MRATIQTTLLNAFGIAVILAVTALTGPPSAEGAHPDVAFIVDDVSEGVFLLRPVAARPELSNSLIVEREDGLLVVGPQASTSGAGELLQVIASISDKPVRYLVLTHAHAESVGGAAAFPESTLVIGSVRSPASYWSSIATSSGRRSATGIAPMF